MNVVCRYLVPNGYTALTVFPFVFYKDVKYITPKIENHERIHLKQQLEMLVIPFFIWYVVEYIIRIVEHRSLIKAYRNISFEKEAYGEESNINYLKTRKFYSWIKYLK